MQRTWLIALCVACGGGGSSANPDDLIRACIVLNACTGADLDTCALQYGPNMSGAQIDCVASAGGDCVAARACIGLTTTVAACTPGCADPNTLVRCSGGIRQTFDCRAYVEDVGPNCVMGTSRTDCGGATCTVDGERTCAGVVSTACDSGITEVINCALYGLECTTGSRRCVGAAVGTCIAGSTAVCNGTHLVECIDTTERSSDCSKRVPGMTCVVGADGAACAFGDECSGGATMCANNVLDACIAGRVISQDCTALGFTTCANGSCR